MHLTIRIEPEEDGRWLTEVLEIPHRILSHSVSSDIVLASHDDEEIGPKMLARIAKYTDLHPEDL